MRAQVITYVPCVESTHSIATAAYEFRADRPMRWLQRACIAVLKRLKCHHMHGTVTVERHVITEEKELRFLQRLQKQGLDMEYIFYRKPKYLLIGPEEYTALMDEPTSAFMWKFHITHQDFAGLTVHVIPWMSGILVVPEL